MIICPRRKQISNTGLVGIWHFGWYLHRVHIWCEKCGSVYGELPADRRLRRARRRSVFKKRG